ncbi:TniB protein [Rhizobium sp. PP-CC-2G-626]|nr:TniB protein [Rhizobium sp. PP-CC-2G-626]
MVNRMEDKDLDAVARLDLLAGAQWWIGYDRAQEALRKFEHLLRYGPGRLRPPNALLLSPTNNGKSMVIEKFRRDHTLAPDMETGAETLPVVVVQMPTNPTIGRFYAALLAETGAPGPRAGGGVRTHDLEQMALTVLRAIKARVLVIDELHNMLAGSASARREFLNLLRYLGNALRIPLIGVGTQEAYMAIRTDPQLVNRFEPIILPLWEPDSETATLLMSFAASLPLRGSSPDLLRPDIIGAIVARTGGTIGEMLALLRAAAIVAVETGEEAINEQTLRAADYRGPIERRISIERQLVPG